MTIGRGKANPRYIGGATSASQPTGSQLFRAMGPGTAVALCIPFLIAAPDRIHAQAESGSPAEADSAAQVIEGAPTPAADVDELVEPIADSIRRWVPAKVIERAPPTYPGIALNNRSEGWVHVTYCIDESGQTRNISILDSVGGNRFSKAARQAVEGWRFEPAMQNGTSVWQSGNEAYVFFRLSGRERAADKTFARQYKKINKLIAEREYTKAEQVFLDVLEKFELSMYELSMLWVARVRLEADTNDLYELRMALHRATVSDGELLEDHVHHSLLEMLVKVNVNLGKMQEAIQTFDELVELTGASHPAVVSLDPTIESVRSYMSQEAILSVNAGNPAAEPLCVLQ